MIPAGILLDKSNEISGYKILVECSNNLGSFYQCVDSALIVISIARKMWKL